MQRSAAQNFLWQEHNDPHCRQHFLQLSTLARPTCEPALARKACPAIDSRGMNTADSLGNTGSAGHNTPPKPLHASCILLLTWTRAMHLWAPVYVVRYSTAKIYAWCGLPSCAEAQPKLEGCTCQLPSAQGYPSHKTSLLGSRSFRFWTPPHCLASAPAARAAQ